MKKGFESKRWDNEGGVGRGKDKGGEGEVRGRGRGRGNHHNHAKVAKRPNEIQLFGNE